MKQKVDVQAKKSLEIMAKYFSPIWGDMEITSQGAVFTAPPKPLSKIKIINKRNKSLLGGLYNLQIIGEVNKEGLNEMKTPITINYKGIMVKGKAYFKNKFDKYKKVIDILNKDMTLIEELDRFDLESGEIWQKNGKYIIKLTPLSGAYMYVVFPPLTYSSMLKKNEVNSLQSALLKISKILEKNIN